MEDGCIVWGSRVVVPSPGRRRVLQQLHEGHPGMAQMKGLARMYMWWPRMDEDVAQVVHSCHECQKNQAAPPHAPLQPWSWPKQPWSRLHLDFAGPMLNRMFLVVVDAHTKWIEVFPMSNSTSFSTIQQLRTLFVQFGIPRTVVTDNGPCFISEEFREFIDKNGIHHIRSSPYHPASNGLAERAVRVFKEGLKKMKEGTILDKIACFLFSCRNIPHSTTGVSLAELMFGRQLHSRLDLLRPSLESRVEHNQQRQKEGHDQHARERQFSVSDCVYVCNFGQGELWLPGIISEVTGPVSYTIELTDGRTVRRHQDHVRMRHDMSPEPQLVPQQVVEPVAENLSSTSEAQEELDSDQEQCVPQSRECVMLPQPERHYPLRERHPPERFM